MYLVMCMLTEALLRSAPLTAPDAPHCHPQPPPVGASNRATEHTVQDGVNSCMQHEKGNKGEVHHLIQLNTKQGEDEADLMGKTCNKKGIALVYRNASMAKTE